MRSKRDNESVVDVSQSNNSFFMTPRKTETSIYSTMSAASMTTTSEHKRHKKATGALNGEIRVVSKNLNNAGYDKTQTQRIEEAVGKVESLAAREPDLETKMTQHLQEEKERGNLSFSKDEDFINSSDNHDLTTLSKDSITTAGATTSEQSKCALLCEAINALERSK